MAVWGLLLKATLGCGAWVTKAWMPEAPTAVAEPVMGQNDFGIISISPNPASEAVAIAYFLEKPALLQMDVVNVLGQKVATLVSGKQTPGHYSRIWNGKTSKGLPANPGIYYVRLRTGNQNVVKPLIWK